MENFHHLPVLLKECMAQLNLRDGCDYLDCTLGGGGHSSQILAGIQGGSLTGIDRDADAIAAATGRITDPRFQALRGNFHDAQELTDGRKFDGIGRA